MSALDPSPAAAAVSPWAEEASFVAALCAGEPAAYERLVRENAGRLLVVLRRLLGSDDDAQDALQDAFVSAWRNVASFSGQSRVSTWMHRIAVNAALMKLRARRARPETPIDDLLPKFVGDDGHHLDPPSRWDDRADLALERRETRATVRAAIDRLPEAYRTVLVLRDVEGLSTDDTSQVLGVTPNAVKVRLHRAHQALRTLLDPHFRSDPTPEGRPS